MSVIDITFTTLEIVALDSWIIEDGCATPSGHKMIVFELVNLYETIRGMGTT